MKLKHILYILLCLILQSPLHAQVKNNRWVFGGDVGYTSSGGTSYFGLAPEVGYLIKPMVEIGGSIGYTYITNGSAKRNLWTFGPHVNVSLSESFFLRGKFQHLTGKETDPSIPSFNISESSLWLGGGYQTNTSGVFYRVGFLYNTLYNANSSIYSSPLLPYASLGYRL